MLFSPAISMFINLELTQTQLDDEGAIVYGVAFELPTGLFYGMKNSAENAEKKDTKRYGAIL